MKQAVLIIVILSLLLTAGSGLSAVEKSTFLNEYEAFQTDIEQKMIVINSREAYDKLMTEMKSGLESLLAKHEADQATDQVELLRARILINLKKYQEADSKLETLLAKKSPLLPESQLFKAKILIETEKIALAVPLFRQAEAKLPRTLDFFEVSFSLAFEAPDEAVRKEYSRKLLAAADLPKKYSGYRAYLVMTLAGIEMKKRNIPAAKKILRDGIKSINDERGLEVLQSALKQLEFVGQPAPSIAAENWLNTDPLTIAALKGKVVIIDFWAPWCPPCRKVIPTLVQDFKKYRDQGLVVIGFTKLYGSYRDDIQNKGKVEADEEKTLIKGFVERNGLTYPVAIAASGDAFDRYGVNGIPTMVFIDKAGNIYDIAVGSDNEAEITERIKLLLAAK